LKEINKIQFVCEVEKETRQVFTQCELSIGITLTVPTISERELEMRCCVLFWFCQSFSKDEDLCASISEGEWRREASRQMIRYHIVSFITSINALFVSGRFALSRRSTGRFVSFPYWPGLPRGDEDPFGLDVFRKENSMMMRRGPKSKVITLHTHLAITYTSSHRHTDLVLNQIGLKAFYRY